MNDYVSEIVSAFVFVFPKILPLAFAYWLYSNFSRIMKSLMFPPSRDSNMDILAYDDDAEELDVDSEESVDFDSDAFSQEYYLHPWDIPEELLYRRSGDKAD